MKLFVYATLKNRETVRKVLHHKVAERRAVLPEFHEIPGKWPTVTPMTNAHVKGEVFDVTADDLVLLDAWENNYKRRKVATSAGQCWIYEFDTDKAIKRGTNEKAKG